MTFEQWILNKVGFETNVGNDFNKNMLEIRFQIHVCKPDLI